MDSYIQELIENSDKILKDMKDTNEILKNINSFKLDSIFDDDFRSNITDLENFQKELKNNEFEIGVIGREKTGKSSFINAWIGHNFLPTDSKRCTYTTTQVKSCSNVEDQRIEIQYFTVSNFHKYKNKIKKELDDEKKLSNFEKKLYEDELQEITDFHSDITKKIQEYENEPEQKLTKKFTDFNEIKSLIKSAISEPSHARAVEGIVLWTTNLLCRQGITLFDVPGYDSPMFIHKKQTLEKAQTVNAIIFLKDFNAPSIVDSETQMINEIKKN